MSYDDPKRTKFMVCAAIHGDHGFGQSDTLNHAIRAALGSLLASPSKSVSAQAKATLENFEQASADEGSLETDDSVVYWTR